MTDIAFHSGVPDKLAYACRLLRKAYRQNAKVIVSGPSDALSRLDKTLWVFDDLEFIPHLYVRSGTPVPAPLRRTPIWLIESGVEPLHHDVLLHLGDQPAEGHERFARLIEVVSDEEADRLAARQRWRHYESNGHALTHHVAGVR